MTFPASCLSSSSFSLPPSAFLSPLTSQLHEGFHFQRLSSYSSNCKSPLSGVKYQPKEGQQYLHNLSPSLLKKDVSIRVLSNDKMGYDSPESNERSDSDHTISFFDQKQQNDFQKKTI